jgi:hypothetical protein
MNETIINAARGVAICVFPLKNPHYPAAGN